MKIYTLPVSSRLASMDEIPAGLAGKTPDGLRLSRHQVYTYQALTQGSADVIFNTALTGDGKSLAGQLPALLRDFEHPTIAMYPTNELIADQKGQFENSKQRWDSKALAGRLDGPRLDEIMAEIDYTRRGEALMKVLRNKEVVLTNPDIFHLVMHQFYTYGQDAPDRYAGPLANRFSQFTFDEFHIFNAPQIVSVLNALLFIHEIVAPTRLRRFLFLSATPNNLMLKYLERSGLNVVEIQGEYCYEDAPDPLLWRPILRPATINFDNGAVDAWVDRHLEDILLPFFLERTPKAKGAIIVNSRAAAYRLIDRLRPVFQQHHLTVEPNTGLTSRSLRAISYEADLLVGTSTVDVGIDFQINFLLFESRDAGSFLQRLGRLGRHTGYVRDGRFHAFEDFVAHALVPPWVEASLFQGGDGVPALLKDGQYLQRDELGTAIQIAYPPTASFDNYASRWGKFQSIRILSGLNKATVRDQYQETRTRLERRYEDTFQVRLHPATWEYRRMLKEQPALLKEAIAFRGGSYFTCCLIDETESGKNRFKTADILSLAPNACLEALEEVDFYRQAGLNGCQRTVFERQNPLGFFYLRGWHEKRQDMRIYVDHRMVEWGADRFGKALSLSGLKIEADIPGLARLNNHLCRRKIPSLLCADIPPLELKRRLRLPLLFAIYPFHCQDDLNGSIAFGREALLLETRLIHSKFDCGGGAIIF